MDASLAAGGNHPSCWSDLISSASWELPPQGDDDLGPWARQRACYGSCERLLFKFFLMGSAVNAIVSFAIVKSFPFVRYQCLLYGVTFLWLGFQGYLIKNDRVPYSWVLWLQLVLTGLQYFALVIQIQKSI